MTTATEILVNVLGFIFNTARSVLDTIKEINPYR